MSGGHVPVLFQETLDGLQIKPDGVYLDGTFGRGGHAAAILDRLGSEGRLYACDKDPDAVAIAQRRFADDPRFHIWHGSFAELGAFAAGEPMIAAGFDGILFDLGVSSPQLDVAERGFSFLRDGPLDMRMNNQAGQSAAEWLATARQDEIADVLHRYGEERFRGRIARSIVEARQKTAINSTAQLAEIIANAVPRREKGKHPATRSFQAIRIHINRELADLEAGLALAVKWLRVGGYLAVIAFHSLEDRIVKRFIRDAATSEPAGFGRLEPKLATLRASSKAIRAGEAELEGNPRARSAVLRVAERLPGGESGVAS